MSSGGHVETVWPAIARIIQSTKLAGTGHSEAAERSLANMAYMGDALITDTDELCGMMGRGASDKD